MRKTRFMSLLFLVWSVAFFFVPEFRQGLRGMAFVRRLVGNFQYFEATAGISVGTLQRLAQTAEQHRDAQTVAFVALHSPVEQDRVRLAEQAVALDPQLTWIFRHLMSSISDNVRQDQWLARLELWDPDNAFFYLTRGEQIRQRRGKNFPANQDLDGLAKETAWREAMAKAFAAPRYDSYWTRRFHLERTMLRQHHLESPERLLVSVVGMPIPLFANISAYRDLLVKKLGKEAEQSGHLPEAMGYYWTVAHFGERMQLHGPSAIDKLIGASLQTAAYEQLLPHLRAAGRADEALTVEYVLKEIPQLRAAHVGREPLAESSNYTWAVFMLYLSGGLVVLFGLFTAVCVIYVNAKRWVRPEKKGRLFRLLTGAENYVPIFLFLSCAGFYLSYYPYAANFNHYMNVTAEIHNFEPLTYNIIPNYLVQWWLVRGTPLGNPFVPYIWYALGGLGLIVIISLLSQLRASPAGPAK